MRKMFFGWLVRELEKINKKLDRIILELEDLREIAEQTERLKTSSEELEKAIEEQQPKKGTKNAQSHT